MTAALNVQQLNGDGQEFATPPSKMTLAADIHVIIEQPMWTGM